MGVAGFAGVVCGDAGVGVGVAGARRGVVGVLAAVLGLVAGCACACRLASRAARSSVVIVLSFMGRVPPVLV